MDDGVATPMTTSAGMPHLPPARDALDSGTAPKAWQSPFQSFVDQGKAQVTGALDGVADAVHDLASRLQDNGAEPVADYVRKAAEAVVTWSQLVDRKSVEELATDTRDFVRRSPLLAVTLTVTAGFFAARYLRATTPARAPR